MWCSSFWCYVVASLAREALLPADGAQSNHLGGLVAVAAVGSDSHSSCAGDPRHWTKGALKVFGYKIRFNVVF